MLVEIIVVNVQRMRVLFIVLMLIADIVIFELKSSNPPEFGKITFNIQ